MLAVLASLELVESPIGKGPEALGASVWFQHLIDLGTCSFTTANYLHKALGVPQLPVRVDDLLVSLELFVAARAEHGSQGRHCNTKTRNVGVLELSARNAKK